MPCLGELGAGWEQRLSSSPDLLLEPSEPWCARKLEEVIIENAPRLERLTPRSIRHEGFVIRVIQAPKLKTLGYKR